MTTRFLLCLAGVFGLAAPGSAQTEPPRPVLVSPPPPATSRPAQLIDFEPGEVRCGAEVVAPITLERPFPAWKPGPDMMRYSPSVLRFRIDETGRPLGIARAPDNRFSTASEDAMPALAASRFPAGRAREDCRISYQARAFAISQAPMPVLQRYFVSPHRRQPGERDLFRAIHPAGTTCIDPPPQVRLRAFPNFKAIPQAPGTWSYAMTAFDIDASGKPVNVRIASSDGNAALDRAVLAAVRESRFASGARTGCTYPYYRRSEPLKAPAMPDRASFIPADARCPAVLGGRIGTPTVAFPAAFQSRRIEGWAVIAYDVAPWGQRGNARIVASEPAAVFGEVASGPVLSLRQTASPTGGTGCIEVVRFAMPPMGEDAEEDQRRD
jgi:TonB family protein